MSQQADQGEQPSERTPRKSRKGRRLLMSVLALVALLVLLVLLLPTLISTGAGTSATLGVVKRVSGYHVDTAAVGVSWLGGQRLRELSVTPPNERWSLTVDRLEASEASLFHALFGGRQFGHIEAGEIRFAQKSGSDTEGDAPPAPDGGGDGEATMPSFPKAAKGLRVSFAAERFTYVPAAGPEVVVSDFQASADASDVQSVTASVSGRVSRAGESGRFDAKVNLRDAFTAAGEPRVEQARVEGDAAIEDVPIPAVDELAQANGRLTALLGPTLNAQVSVPSTSLSNLQATVTAESETLEDVKLALSRDGDRLRGAGSTAQFTLTPEAYASLTGGGGEGAAALLRPVTWTLDVNELAMPRPGGERSLREALAAATVDVSLTASDVAMRVPGQGEASLAGLELTAASERLGERVEARLTGELAMADETAPVETRLTVDHPLAARPAMTLVGKGLPIVTADAIAKQQGRLAGTLGRTLDVNLTLKPATAEDTGRQGYRVDGRLSSSQLQAPLVGALYPPDRFELKTAPEPLKLTLPVEAANAWLDYAQPSDAGRLSRVTAPVNLTADIRRLTLVMREAGGIDYGQSGILATANIPELAVVDRQSGRRTSQRVSIDVEGQDLEEQLKAVLNVVSGKAREASPDESEPGESQRDSDEGEGEGELTSTTTITNFVDRQGRLAVNSASIDSKTTLTQMPTALLETLAGQGGAVTALLGEVMSGEATVKHQAGQGGPVRLDLNAKNLQASLAGSLSADKTLTLREDATLSVNVTPGVSRVFLRRITPVLGSALAAEAPLKLTVRRDGFRMPLSDFSLARIAADARLHGSQITLASEGVTGQLLNVVSRVQALNMRERYGATLRETNLQLRDGRLSYDRLPIALGAGGVVLISDGTVHLAEGRFDVGIALAGDRIPREVRGVAIPVAGPIDKPRISTDKFLANAVKQGLLERGLSEVFDRVGKGKQKDGESKGKRDAGSIFENILKGNRGGKDDGGSDKQADKKQDEDEKRDDPLGGLLNRLRKNQDKD